MDVWLTYSLSDFLLFSPRTYYRLFELANAALWPLHVAAAALGLSLVVLLHRGGAWRGRAIAAILAACWLWVAWDFLYGRYDPINWMARYFAVGFVVQALLFVLAGVVLDRFSPAGVCPVGRAAGLSCLRCSSSRCWRRCPAAPGCRSNSSASRPIPRLPPRSACWSRCGVRTGCCSSFRSPGASSPA
jgi:hypothetical protein